MIARNENTVISLAGLKFLSTSLIECEHQFSS